MKILVICQYYYPEPFRITDICEELVGRGHEVTVITGVPNYPMGRVYDGYKQGENRDQTINGVKVQQGNSQDMIFHIDELIAYISQFYTLKIGDLIFTGTPAGVGLVKIGDHLEGYLEETKVLDFFVK